MISPALRISTVSPIRISFSAMKSWLCSVAFVTVVPARRTGATTAFGVSTPVLPTWMTISRTDRLPNLRRIFIRGGPAREFGRAAQGVPVGQAVHLDDGSVDVIGTALGV